MERLAIYESKKELHQLLRRVIKSTKLGRRHSAYDDSWGLDIGGGEMWSCFKFEQLDFSPIESREEYDCDEIQIDDLDMIKLLIDEVRDRYKTFQLGKKENFREYIKNKKKFAKRIFDKSIKNIVNMYAKVSK